MALWDTFDALTPHGRLILAAGPFVFAMLLRLVIGRTTFTRYFVSAATLWFLVNVLIAPYSQDMSNDLRAFMHRIF